MQKRSISGVAVAVVAASTVVGAQNGTPINPNSKNTLTVAVYGDSPYGTIPTDTTQTDKTLAFIDSINQDPKVDLVLHVGDIHSGSQFCIGSLRSPDLRPVDHVQEPAHLHARRQRMGRLPQG